MTTTCPPGLPPHTRVSLNGLTGWRLRLLKRISDTLLATLFIFGLAANVAVASQNKVEICHLPPDNPDNTQTIRIQESDVAEHLAHGDLLGACPPTAAELDPPTVRLDPDLEPPVPSIAGIGGGPARGLVRMHSDIGPGYRFDFVMNEVFLVSDDPADLADFQSRWPSELLLQIPLPPPDPLADPTVIYLLGVDPSTANTRRLDKDLAGLDPRLHGQHQVSSEAGLQLLALVAGEIRNHGLRVGINVLARSQDFFDGISEEAMTWSALANPITHYGYQPNAFDWPYLDRNPDMPGDDQWPLDTGVAHALRAVEAQGRLTNRVRALIADGGFYPNQDFPPYTMVGPLRTTNPDPTGCGSGSPPDPASACGAHGTHVLMAGFARPDNAFGTLGPGGAVSDLILVQSPSIDFGALLDFITESIPTAISERPKIINISAAAAIAAGWCFIACEPIDLVVQWLADQGIVVVAAAGNEGVDVDATDEFCTIGCVTFEEAAFVPCETDHVVCVGAHTYYQSRRTSYSNFGSTDDGNSVDIFAPGDFFGVDAIQADNTTALRDDLELHGGTSYASPFVAGVFALTWAANPALTRSQLLNCVLGTAHTGSYTGEHRRINALGAVSCAMGGTHPWVEIRQPVEGTAFVRGEETVTLQADSDDYEDGALPIHWASSIDGALATTDSGTSHNLGTLGLSIGAHHICAEVTDSSARSWDDCVNVDVTSAPPLVEILQPIYNSEYYQSDTIPLHAVVTDLDGPPPTDIEWRIGQFSQSWSEMTPVATTLDASVPASDFGLGWRRVSLQVTDEYGAIGTDFAAVLISATPDNLPPVITISEPEPGAMIDSPDGGPVLVRLVASAEDPEDGTIPFADIDWYFRTGGEGPYDSLEVTTTSTCIIYNPILMRCDQYEVVHSIELAPIGSQTSTQYEIRGIVSDSQGQSNGSGNGTVTVFVTQFI